MRGLLSMLRMPLAMLALLALGALAPAAPASAQPANPLDCDGPVADAEPGTAEWLARDANNVLCALERHADKVPHPASLMPLSTESFGLAPMPLTDAYREPERHAGKRFRFLDVGIENRRGETLDAELYLPCSPRGCADRPPGVRVERGPYPAVVVLHGGGSRKELHWWSTQTLAEAGYVAIAFNGAAGDHENARDVLRWLRSSPERPTPAGQVNPAWRQVDRGRVGLAGHSQGGQTASVLGQLDRRVRAIVSWDRGTGQQLPRRLDTPTLFFVADYDCQANPICQPEPYLEAPEGEGPAGRGREYDIVRAARVDSMKLALRATAHLEWTPSIPAGNRYAELVSVYYTVAWFDRYLKPRGQGRAGLRTARRAFRRLVGERLDASADRLNVSQGHFDPVAALGDPGDVFAGNAPYEIAGMATRDRLSFYFDSKCFITPPRRPGVRFASTDVREEGCTRASPRR